MPEQTREFTIDEALDFGTQMSAAGNIRGAMGLFRGVLMHEPNNFEAIERLGTSLFELKEYHEALYWFWRGRKVARKHPLALTNYALTLSQLGHTEEALPELHKAIYLAEKNKDQFSAEVMGLCYNNYGNALERVSRHDEALAALEKSIAYKPNDSFPHYNRGICLMRLNRHREAIASFDHGLALKADNPDALYNRGMARLLLGDLKGGFEDYEARLLTSENKTVNLGLPIEKKWHGEPLEGKTILVHCEQGLGDDIQFLRFMPLLRDLNPAKTLLIPHSGIRAMIFDEMGLEFRVSGEPIAHADYDYWVPLMSLPMWLGVDEEAKIPRPWRPLLPFEFVEKWRSAAHAPGKLNVGVCWAGQWLHKNDKARSIPLDVFSGLFEADNCTFNSVQQLRPGEGEPFAALKVKYPNLRQFTFTDFRDTAGVLLNCDMVISADTSVAHLAASFGIPTAVLVPAFGTDWRWQLDRDDSPWYPSMTLCRQPKVGDWKSVISQLYSTLSVKAQRLRAA